MKSPSSGLQRVGTTLAVLALLLTILVVLRYRRHDSTPLSTARSIAVLIRSGETVADDQDHLAAGLSVDLLDRLQSIEALRCVPQTEVLALRRSTVDRRLLAKKLGAETLVVGSVQAPTGRLQITLEIVDARTDRVLETIVLEDSTDRVLDLQSRVARRVVEALPVSTTRKERRHLTRQSTRSLKAWEAFAQGSRYLGDLVNPRAAEFAADLLQRAVQLDPDFAQAQARLSLAQWLGFMRDGDPGSLREAERTARRALDIRPELTASVTALVLALQSRPDGPGELSQLIAETSPRQPADRIARAVAANWLRVGELETAESSWLTAIELAPAVWFNLYGYGQFLLRGGRHAEAEQAFLEAGRLAPIGNTWPAENVLALRLAAGDLAGALQLFESLDRRPPETELLRQIAIAYAVLGRLDPAEILYREILQSRPSDARSRQELGDLLTRSGRLEEAATEYRSALDHYRRQVGTRPDDPDQQRFLALLAAKGGACPEALPVASTLIRHQVTSAEIAHDLARVFAICGDLDLALEALGMAIRHGLPPELIRAQPEFDPLVNKEEFANILDAAAAPPPRP